MPAPSAEPAEALYGAHIQRSMTLLATSTAARRHAVKVLIYGQSITGSDELTALVGDYLKGEFPYADVTLENRSIGGFEAPRLIRTAQHDLYPFYPDLLIFHVYQGQTTGEVERLITNVRKYTTADIVLVNDHRQQMNPPTAESINFWRELAAKYDCELVDVSREWPRYLAEHGLKPEALLRDKVHPNVDGYRLWTILLAKHLKYNPVFPGSWSERVRYYEARRPLDEKTNDEITLSGDGWKQTADGIVSSTKGDRLQLKFQGNRVDLIAATWREATGSAQIFVDGKPPSSSPSAYAITLPSKGPNTWFPAIRQVGFRGLPKAEKWTLRITRMKSEDGSDFDFEVTGSQTGPDGDGNSQRLFVSHSGGVVIEPRDWMLADIKRIFHQNALPPVGFSITWDTVGHFLDVYKAVTTPDSSRIYSSVLVQGIQNQEHTLEILVNGDGSVPIKGIQAYRPPMK
jgi:hypothetical protein